MVRALKVVVSAVCLGVFLYGFSIPSRLSTDSTSKAVSDLKQSLDQANVSRSLSLLQLPMRFEANHGQAESEVKFLSRGRGYTLFLTSHEAVLVLAQPSAFGKEDAAKSSGMHFQDRQNGRREALRNQKFSVLRLQFAGANANPAIEGVDELSGKSNYFMGNDSSKWHTDIPNFSKVMYRDIYPGIDLVFYGSKEGELEYDFIVSPGADPKVINVKFEGADKIGKDQNGDLILYIPGGELRQHKPNVFQESDAVKEMIEGQYLLKDSGLAGFNIASYKMTRPLVIDPVLSYSTYFGGSNGSGVSAGGPGLDYGTCIVVDVQNSIYLGGIADPVNFPGVRLGPNNPFVQNFTFFVTKINPATSTVIYSVYFGSSYRNDILDIAVDALGNVYAAGAMDGRDYPVTSNAFQSVANVAGFAGGQAVVTKIGPSGNSLLYSSYLGGTGSLNGAVAIAVDALGNAYVAGFTNSLDFPGSPQSSIRSSNPNAVQSANRGGGSDAFLVEISQSGTSVMTVDYFTYIGGSGYDDVYGIAIDSSGNAYIVGATNSADFPLAGTPIQSSLAPCTLGSCNQYSGDTFISKINTNAISPATALVYSTYLGGNGDDRGSDIAIDGAGNAYITGETESTNFAVVNALQNTLGGPCTIPFAFEPCVDMDAFVAKINPVGSALLYSTYLGGTEFDYGNAIAVDSYGSAYVAGQTWSSDFHSVSAIQPVSGGFANNPGDAFITQINPQGNSTYFSTYLGGSGVDDAFGIVLGPTGVMYVTGQTSSTNFPMAGNPVQPTLNGTNDAYVAVIGHQT